MIFIILLLNALSMVRIPLTAFAFLGGAIAAAIAPAKYRRTALIFGAVVNSLPDLDVLPLLLSDDPVVRMTWHRAATHSLLLLPFVALLLWWWSLRKVPRWEWVTALGG